MLNNHPILVETISHEGINHGWQPDGEVVDKCETYLNLIGISLTEEILLKCGFERINHFTVTNSLVFDVGRGRYLSIGDVGSPNEMLWLCTYNEPGTNDIINLWNYDYDGKLYLHALQNIAHSFTSKKLEINL